MTAQYMRISAVILLIAANVAVYLLQSSCREAAREFVRSVAAAVLDGRSYFHVWQIVTYAFLHDTQNYTHILFNMLGLFMFGAEIERYVGPAAC